MNFLVKTINNKGFFMIENIITNMTQFVLKLKKQINQDIEERKEARHEEHLVRNDEKHFMIDEITNLKAELNKQLILKIQQGEDVNVYRESVDLLEQELKELYELNKKLASIVLPVQQMYKELVSEISAANGGRIFDIKAQFTIFIIIYEYVCCKRFNFNRFNCF